MTALSGTSKFFKISHKFDEILSSDIDIRPSISMPFQFLQREAAPVKHMPGHSSKLIDHDFFVLVNI